MPNLLWFVAISSCIPISRTSIPIPFSPYSIPLLLSSRFTQPLPFPKEMNKELSYCRQNALSVVKAQQCNTVSDHTVFNFLSTRQSRLAGVVMISTCPFVRSSVCLSVRSSVNAILRKRLNCWRKSTLAKDMNRPPRGQEFKPQGHERPNLYWESWRRHHSGSLESTR